MASSHRPPVLFQSDDDDHPHHHINDHSHHAFGDVHNVESRATSTGLLGHQQQHNNDMRHGQSSAHIDGRGHSQERGHGYLYDELEHLDDPPPHVHSQACFDSCPVQDIYTETSFSRFSKGARTNLYGLVVVKELGQVTTTTTTPPTSTYSGLGPHDLPLQDPQSKPMELPLPPPATRAVTSGVMSRTTSTVRNKTSIFTETGDLAYRHLPARYVLVAAGGSIKFFLGLQDTFDFTLGPSELNPPQGAGTEGSGGGGGGGVATAPPPNLEIVSMDAFERKDERGCQLVLVVSIAKAEDPAQFELRFYGVNTFAPSIRELLLQFPSTTDIQTVPLTWAPTKIIHAPLEDDPFEMVVLVGGSDSRVHIFVQDAPTTILTSMSAVPEIMPSDNLFKEQPIDTLFSVLASFPYCEYCVLSLVIKDYLTCRVIAAGTQNGTLNVGIIPRDPVTFQLDRDNAKSHTVVLFSPITTLTVYTSRVPTERRRRQKHGQAKQEGQDIQDATVDDADQEIEIEEENGIHLLVTCAIEQAWVYSDINKHGLSRRADLAECSYHDSILAAHAMDADWDGQNEVLIGTYGRQLMVFKQLPPGQEPYPKSGSGVHQQKQPQHTQHHHQQNHPQQQQRHSSNGSSSSTQQLQRQLRNSFQIQQQLHLQQLQQLQQQQQHQQLQQIHPSGLTVSSPSAIGDGVGSGGGGNGVSPVSLPQWGMTWNRRFASPVYGISSADLNDDGLEELVITTINGVSFFLPDPRTAKRRLAQAVERMRQIKEMREILEQLRRDNRKLVEDQRVKEEREKKEEEEEERLRKEKEAEEEAERKEKERRELEMEEIKKKEMEMKELEEQRLLDQQQQQFQQEQDEIKEREPFNESKHEQADTDEKRYGKEAEVDVVEGGEGPVPVKTEREDQKVDISTNADIESEPKKSVAKVEKEEGTSESVVVVAPQIETKKESGDNEANEVSVLKEEAKSEHESPEHDPDVGSQEAVNDENGAVVGKPEEPYLQERVHSTRSDYDDEKPEGD